MKKESEMSGIVRENQALSASEEMYRELIENLNDVIYACDLHGIITYVSPAVKMLIGYEAQEIIGQHFLSFVHEDDRACLQQKFNDAARGMCEDYDFRIVNKSGQIKYVRSSCRLRIIDSRPAGVSGVLADITAQEMAEMALSKSEEKYRTIVETASEGIWYMDCDFRTVFVNSRMAEMLGYSVQEMMGQKVTNFMFAADLPQYERRMDMRKRGRSQIYENRFRRQDGSACWAIVSATSLMDEDGRFLGSFAMFTDITARKQAEQNLAASERKFAAAFQIIPDPVAITDVISGNVIDVNRSFERWSGYSRTELVGRNILDLDLWVNPLDRERFLNILRKGGAVSDLPVNLRTRKGDLCYMQFSASLVKLKEGMYLLERIHDITAEKTAQEVLRESEERLRLALDAARMTTWEWDIRSDKTIRRKDPKSLTSLNKSSDGSISDVVVESPPRRKDLWFDLIIHPDDKEKVNKATQDAISKGSDYYLEFRILQSPEVIRWIASKGHVFLDDNGRPSRLIGIDWDITEREKAREALTESQNRLAEIIDFLPDATLVIDRERKVIAWNKAIEKLTGLKAEAMIGKGNYEYALPFYGERRPILIDLALEYSQQAEKNYEKISWLDERILTGEAYMPYLGSGETYLMGNASLLYDSHGDVAGAIESIRDITERKHMEKDLRIKESAIAGSINAIALFNLIGLITYVNSSFLTLWGYDDMNDVLSRQMRFFFCDEELAEAIRQKVMDYGVYQGKMTAKRRDGTHFVARLSSKLVFSNAGKPLFIMASVIDISEQELAKDELKKAEVKYRNIVKDMPNMLCRFRSDGVLTYVNDEYCRYFARSRESLIGSSFMPLIPEEDQPLVKEKMASLSLANPVVSHEHRVILENGQLRWHRWTDRAIFDDSSTLIEYQSIGEDITDMIAVKEALIKAKDAAEAAARSKSEFLANMSHEIRTPLNAVIGMTDVLMDSELTASQKDTVAIIKNSGNMLISLINDILDFSKIDAGKKEIMLRPFILKSVLDSSLEIIAGKALEKGLALFCHLAKEVPESILGDSTALRQVLINLLSNALKFTESGRIDVFVHSRNVCDPAGQAKGDLELHFSVRDTGMGIPADRMDSLFQSFSQVAGSLTRKYGGTGLGLAISKRLVELMGGRIWAESKLGMGSTFHFTILTKMASAQVQPVRDEKALPDSISLSDLGSIRCLVAEDNAVNQKVALHMLSKLGLSADVASNGMEVLQALQKKPYDLIFMDVAMPEMDGFEACRAIRKQPAWSGIHIIALTAHSLDGDMEKCLASGMDDYISKPVRIDALAHSLKNFLAKKEMLRPSAAFSN